MSLQREVSRRRVLALGAATLGGATLIGAASGRGSSQPSQPPGIVPRRRSLRLAHMTDAHVQPEKAAGAGFAAAMAHMQSQADRPDVVLFGGDNVMGVDSVEGAERARVQLDVWKNVLRSELSLPHHCCIGNHDILRNHPIDGKKWAVEALELPGRYYHMDQSGWRVVVLDSTSPRGETYKGHLDEEQFAWLDGLLASTPRGTHVLVLSHIPILSAAVFFDGDLAEGGDWRVPGSWMHLDAVALKDLFYRHGNVRLCLSGHLHLSDHARYNDTWYCCNGAVSGAWWDGAYHECHTGYGLVDLFDDGSFENRYVTFPWTPRE